MLCVCLEFSDNSQIIWIYGRRIFWNICWRMSSLQNMHFPSSAMFSVLSVHFCQCKTCLKKIPCSSDVDLTFMLLIFLYCFFYPAISGLFCSKQPTKAWCVSLSLFLPCYCRLFYLLPCWNLMFTTFWCAIPANLFIAFPICVYITQTLFYHF